MKPTSRRSHHHHVHGKEVLAPSDQRGRRSAAIHGPELSGWTRVTFWAPVRARRLRSRAVRLAVALHLPKRYRWWLPKPLLTATKPSRSTPKGTRDPATRYAEPSSAGRWLPASWCGSPANGTSETSRLAVSCGTPTPWPGSSATSGTRSGSTVATSRASRSSSSPSSASSKARSSAGNGKTAPDATGPRTWRSGRGTARARKPQAPGCTASPQTANPEPRSTRPPRSWSRPKSCSGMPWRWWSSPPPSTSGSPSPAGVRSGISPTRPPTRSSARSRPTARKPAPGPTVR
jgi:hypothetical protein